MARSRRQQALYGEPAPPVRAPVRPALARPRSEVDRQLKERIQAGHDIQKKFGGSNLHLLPSTKWRSDYQKAVNSWREYNLDLLNVIFTDDRIAKEYDSPYDALLGGDMEKNSRLLGMLERSVDNQISALETIRGRLELYTEAVPSSGTPTKAALPIARPDDRSKVFVVHGREEGPREAVARFLERLGFQPIILHEQANLGMTVIEKVEANSDVGFAVIILTPDDVGGLKGEALQPRARQNVLLELGYFIGKLTRRRVCTLKVGELEIPSDWRGVVDEPYDAGGGWRQTLARELAAAEYEVDWNKVMRP